MDDPASRVSHPSGFPLDYNSEHQEYLRQMDAQILRLILEGYSCSQIRIEERHYWEGNVFVFSGRILADGPPVNLGKRHGAAT